MQDRKKRPVGTGTGDGTDTDFEKVSVPPVPDITKELAEALNQVPDTCAWGCSCEPCRHNDCAHCSYDKRMEDNTNE